MLKYTLFPEVESQVEGLLKHLNLTPELVYCDANGYCSFRFDAKSGHESGHHYYLGRIALPQGKIIIKIQLDYPNLPEHVFIRHKNFLKEQTFSKENSVLLKGMPKYIDSGRYQDLNWLTYHYVPGEALGMAHTTNQELSAEQIATLCSQIAHISQSTPNPATNLPRKDGAFFQEHLQEFFHVHSQILDQLVSQSEREKLENLGREFGSIIDAQEPGLVHGDFHPGNIILDPNGSSVSIIDWEHVHLGTPLLDLAILWIRSWRTSWRNQLIKTAKQQLQIKNFDSQFRYLVSHLLLDELDFWSELTKRPDHPLHSLAAEALKCHRQVFTRALETDSFWD